MDLQTHLRAELVRYLVKRNITCTRTGEVLDVRTCVVLLDSDGDPAAVLSQEGWREILADPRIMADLAAANFTVDPSTVQEA